MKILYFASLKENLKLAGEQMQINTNTTVADLRKLLQKKHGKSHFSPAILCAVNQQIASDEYSVNDSDEVAFFPMVTGG